jgi:hypothetical protein
MSGFQAADPFQFQFAITILKENKESLHFILYKKINLLTNLITKNVKFHPNKCLAFERPVIQMASTSFSYPPKNS